jgi:DNA-binding MarR family transcriptional regulator
MHNAAVLLVRHLSFGHGQSLTSTTVLALLDDEGPVRISALTAGSGVTQPSMTELVARLQREGLVTRLNDPQDARVTLVDITARGHAHRVKLQKSVYDRLIELLDRLPDDSRVTLRLAMRVAAPFIDQLTELASQHPE